MGRLLLVLLVMQVGLAVGWGWRARRADDWLPPTSGMPSVLDEAVTRPLAINGAEAAMAALARTLMPDARLVSAGMQVDWPEDAVAGASISVPAAGWLTYVYLGRPAAGDGRQATVGFFIERSAGLMLDVRVEEWNEFGFGSLEIEAVKVSATVASLAAELRGGEAYRIACPARRNLSRVALMNGATGPVWVIQYEDAVSGKRGILVTVDAITGDVGEPVVRETRCD